ncbi:hypothetical protein DDB_G0280737 [Dictyostelium discoideum AX4]|uniref:Transmembrane protein n=1 Tax=Dictyostelium discoideum TaxID=44689 RepID=Q54UX7_DICDI|nr:hypothetical protein DDB_G0280737 [Dictyostelium discoideum AX4]EAL67170.1 hypothetical protein DDB_G0280737 [Dictyostelium discoideum AX4]|eukprot:XP_641154.1 hypothetical protein DDB_G0280737 [Dictyostelium discoideum AX4]
MKLLLSLILVMTIALNCCKSFSMGTNKIDYSKIENQLGQQQCFTSSGQLPTSYSSSYVMLSFNGNYPTPSGIQQSSFLESGFINIDLVGEQFTQYVSVNVNGTDYCFQQPLSYSAPSLEGLKYVGDFELGTVQCDMFSVNPGDLGNSSNVGLLVDKSDCSLISGSTENINNTPSGYTLTNYYYYNPSADSSYFQLPSICLNQPNSKQLKLKSSSVQLPKVLGNLPF